jgi:hypothetical protein
VISSSKHIAAAELCKKDFMTQQLVATQTRVGIFESISQADGVVRRLLEAGFSKEQHAVICL